MMSVMGRSVRRLFARSLSFSLSVCMFDGNGLDRNALRQMWRGRERYSASWKCFRWRNITHLVFTTVRQPKPRAKLGKLPSWGWKMHKITNRRINKNRKKNRKQLKERIKEQNQNFIICMQNKTLIFFSSLLRTCTHARTRTHLVCSVGEQLKEEPVRLID